MLANVTADIEARRARLHSSELRPNMTPTQAANDMQRLISEAHSLHSIPPGPEKDRMKAALIESASQLEREPSYPTCVMHLSGLPILRPTLRGSVLDQPWYSYLNPQPGFGDQYQQTLAKHAHTQAAIAMSAAELEAAHAHAQTVQLERMIRQQEAFKAARHQKMRDAASLGRLHEVAPTGF